MAQNDENMSYDSSPMRSSLMRSPMKAKLLYARRNFSHVAINVHRANLSAKSVESDLSCPAHASQGEMADLNHNRHLLDPPDQSLKDSQSSFES